jgi:5-methylcytosine-specific restriction endonuclease McrA
MSGPWPDWRRTKWVGGHATKASDWCKANLGWMCGYCGHPIAEGDYSVDHIIPKSIAPELTWEPSNWRPMHRTKKPRWGCPGNCGLGNRGRVRNAQAESVMFFGGW